MTVHRVPEVLTPTLIVLTSIARDIPIARRIIRKALFPVDPKPLAEGEKLNMGCPLYTWTCSAAFLLLGLIAAFSYVRC